MYSPVNKGILCVRLNGSDIAVIAKAEIHTHTHTLHTCHLAEAVNHYKPCNEEWKEDGVVAKAETISRSRDRIVPA